MARMNNLDRNRHRYPAERIGGLLDSVREAVGASSLCVFAFSPVSCSVELVTLSGDEAQIHHFLPKLGYSPVRDVCTDEGIFLVDSVRSVPTGKDRWLRRAIPYSACIGLKVNTANPTFTPCLFAFWQTSDAISETVEVTIRLLAEQVAHVIDLSDNDREVASLLELGEFGKRAASMGHDLGNMLGCTNTDCMTLRHILRENKDALQHLNRMASNLERAIHVFSTFYRRRGTKQNSEAFDVSQGSVVALPDSTPEQRQTQNSFRRILLLEDSHAYGENLAEMLTLVGYEVVWVTSIPDGFSHLSGDYRPDLILSDRHLSGMQIDGCLQRLRQVAPNSTIVIYTAVQFMSREEMERLSSYGADKIISKEGCRRLTQVIQHLDSYHMPDAEAQT